MAIGFPSSPPGPIPAGREHDGSPRFLQLIDELIEAGRMNDRPRFDRLFALAYAIAYRAAWRVTADEHEARRIASFRLVLAVQSGLEASQDLDVDAARV